MYHVHWSSSPTPFLLSFLQVWKFLRSTAPPLIVDVLFIALFSVYVAGTGVTVFWAVFVMPLSRIPAFIAGIEQVLAVPQRPLPPLPFLTHSFSAPPSSLVGTLEYEILFLCSRECP